MEIVSMDIERSESSNHIVHQQLIVINFNLLDEFNDVSLLESLSYDAILNILVCLEPEHLVKFGLLSKECYTLSCSDYLWRRFYPSYQFRFEQAFNIPPPQPLPRVNAKQIYIKESKKVDSISKFVGLWSEQWCDVDVNSSTRISYDGYKISVFYTKNKFSAEFVDFDGSVLRFKLSGGDSGWSFIYSLKIADHGKLTLNVFRIHDDMSFNGIFKLRSESPEEYPSISPISPIRIITSAASTNTSPMIMADHSAMMIDTTSENSTTSNDNEEMTNIDGNIESFQPLSHRQVAF
ncbi:cyclin-like F-box containing protein [Heterostelium album PN500]|uniref:Cyclin-like F-box containing protein n=1 Tax=Heterostelium pallidum (strain ATCC 26659 / Pp 5 / PN500) TaxID=670386 RepID=D3BQB7_HETP5|nr:cyclin-like F-box containing protein [Heterostelium album PN500]EFA76337.1 cyclin-like F-box containing protein [Heterostelium album PN500]|eukprot:XP_020428469.1 cyclin-like F-box containing protein [Heterostelium album PN500]